MKKLLIIIALATIFVACGNRNNIHVTGSVQGGIANGDTLHLVHIRPDGSLQNITSTVVDNGAFELAGEVELPSICNIVTYNNRGRVKSNIDIVAEGAPISVVVLENYARVSGSPLNDELQAYNDSISLMKQLYKRYYDKKAQNSNLSNKAVEEADMVMKVTSAYRSRLVARAIERNINNVVGLHIIKTNFNTLEPAEAVAYIESLPQEYKNDYQIKYMQKYYAALNKYAVGKMYADFVSLDSDGNEHYLSGSVGRGVPVVVSVWSSQNEKSITEQTALKKFSQECGDRISFVGISIDTDKTKWLNAVDRTAPAGLQLSDLKGWNTPILSIYGIDKYPYYILIDSNGVISYRGHQLTELLTTATELAK